MRCKVPPTTFDEKLLCALVPCLPCSRTLQCLQQSKLCEEFDENKMWNMRRCNKWTRKSGFAVLALSKLCALNGSSSCLRETNEFRSFSIRLEEKIYADVNKMHCLWNYSEMCSEFCVHDLVDYPIFIRTEMSRRKRQRISKLKMYENS